MSEPPLVSVLLINRNYARFCNTALESIRDQSWQNIELVVADNASIDDSATTIRRWVDANWEGKPVRWLLIRKELPLARLLNTAIEASSGSFVAAVSSDDTLAPDSLARRIRLLQEHPGKLAVFGDARVIDVDGRVLHASAHRFLRSTYDPLLMSEDKLLSSFIRRWGTPGPVLLWHRCLLDVVGTYDEDLPFEDWDLFLRMAEKRVLLFTPEIVADWRLHRASASQGSHGRPAIYRGFRKVGLKHLTVVPWALRPSLAALIAHSILLGILWAIRERIVSDAR